MEGKETSTDERFKKATAICLVQDCFAKCPQLIRRDA